MRVIICDRCGKQLMYHGVRWKELIIHNPFHSPGEDDEHMHLCEDCLQEVRDLIMKVGPKE